MLNGPHSKIGRNSNENIVVLNSDHTNIDKSTINIYNTSPILLLTSKGQFEAAQHIFQEMMEELRLPSPLGDYFSVGVKKIGNGYKLCCDPKTEDAIAKYPQKIEVTATFNKSEYPGIENYKNIFDYAYRTQTKIRVEAKKYKEYLGDIENPFPMIEFDENGKVYMELDTPEFPPAIAVVLKSGCCEMNTMLRRSPSFENNIILLTNMNEDEKASLIFEFLFCQDRVNTTVNITRKSVARCKDIESFLSALKLIEEIRRTHTISCFIKDATVPFFTITMPDDALPENFPTLDSSIARLYENLVELEKTYACKFAIPEEGFDIDEMITAHVLLASSKGQWSQRKLQIDNSISVNYMNIADSLLSKTEQVNVSDVTVSVMEGRCTLFGVEFAFNKYFRIYKDAKINNIDSVIKAIKSKRDEIKIVFKPRKKEMKEFLLFERFEGLVKI